MILKFQLVINGMFAMNAVKLLINPLILECISFVVLVRNYLHVRNVTRHLREIENIRTTYSSKSFASADVLI